MADPRSIHEFATGEVEATTLLLGDFVDLDAQSGYTTLKMSVSDLGEVLLEDIEYTQDLQTTDKTVIGAINENKSVIGYSYDEYDDTTTSANAYAVDDLCIRNNTLYKCIAPTYGAWDSSKWKPTSIALEIGRIDTALLGLKMIEVSDTITASLTANNITTVSFNFNVPTGYKIAYFVNTTYSSNFLMDSIRIEDGDGQREVRVNVWSNTTYSAQALSGRAVCFPNIQRA